MNHRIQVAPHGTLEKKEINEILIMDSVAKSKMEKTDDEKKVELKKQFTLLHGVAILCGFIIGSGIHIAPTGIMRQVPSTTGFLLLWVVAGGVATIGALCMAELGTTIPRAGEKYTYLLEMFGDFPACLQLWQYFLFTRPSANAIKCILFAQYLVKPFFLHCGIPLPAIQLIAITLACFITFINMINIKASAHLQTICSVLSVATLLIVAVLGFVHIGQGNTGDLEETKTQDVSITVGEVTLALYSASYAYGGWFALNYMIEELKDPYRNLPRAIVISMAVVIILYLSVNMGYLAVLGKEGIVNSNAVAMSFADKTMGKAAWLIPVLIAANQSGSLNGGILIASRLCFAGARRGHLPEVLSMIHINYFSPITALLFQLIVIILMCLVGDMYTLLNNMVFVNVFFDALAIYGLLYWRWTQPNRHRPVKLPLIIPMLFAIISTLLVIVPIFTKPEETVLGMAIVIGTGVPYYFIFVRNIFNIKSVSKYSDSVILLIQKSLLCSKQEE